MNLESLELSSEERQTVRRFNERFLGRRRRVTADTLLDDWTSFVVEVEGGYAGSIDDYANDLTSRDLLEELVRDSQRSLRAKLERVLDPWDERFKQATADDQDALSRFFSIGDGWWWRRRTPKKGRLATYLRQRVGRTEGASDEAIGTGQQD